MRHYGSVSLIISHHPTKFSVHMCCVREDLSFLVCQVTSSDYLVRESRDIMDEFSLSSVTMLQNLVIIDLLEEKILRFQFVT